MNVIGDEYCCKVLDCDAISQVKQKCLNQIYTSAPVSERPQEDQVDLGKLKVWKRLFLQSI